jgi:hypothetical protein
MMLRNSLLSIEWGLEVPQGEAGRVARQSEQLHLMPFLLQG